MRTTHRNLRGPYWLLALVAALGIAVLLGIVSTAPWNAKHRKSRTPNVVIVLVDDFGWGDMGGLFPDSQESLSQRSTIDAERDGIESTRDRSSRQPHPPNNPQVAEFRATPNIESLAEKGIVLTQFLTHSRCSPTRAGLLTGRHYTRVGSGPEVGGTLDLDVSNIARDLQSAGYVTGAFGKWHNGYPNFPADGNGEIVSNRDGIDPTNARFENYRGVTWGPGVNSYGFDEWQGLYGAGGDYFTRLSNWHSDINWWTNRRYTPDVEGYTTEIVAAAAVDFIDRHRDRPFFCYVPMPAPHAPFHILRSDLQALCKRNPGTWQKVRELRSPSTGRRVEDVEQLRCSPGEEFDHRVLDPTGIGFALLVRGAHIYAMDRALGEIVDTLEELDLLENTIVWFMSDNGVEAGGASAGMRGGKGKLYEGGIRVPGIVLWEEELDAESASYEADNTYPHVFQYLDVYPTTLSMIGIAPSAGELDGRDGFSALRSRNMIGKVGENRYFGFIGGRAAVRGERWKLIYNEAGSQQVTELYDLKNDPYEQTSVEFNHPTIRDNLIHDLHTFMNAVRLAMPYFPPTASWITQSPDPSPGEILEVFAVQTEEIENGDRNGLFVRFASAGLYSFDADHLEPTDLMSFDLFVPSDASVDQGFFVTPGRGKVPLYDGNNGVNIGGALLVDEVWPRDEWIRATIGIGSIAPRSQSTNYIAFRSPHKGTYHFYLDNVAILKADGTPKSILWASDADTLPLRYRYRGRAYGGWSTVSAMEGFPFSELLVRAVDCGDRCQGPSDHKGR